MTLRAHIRQASTRWLPALGATVAALALAAGPSQAQARGHGAAKTGSAGAGSAYPAAAEYPRKIARPSEFAHSASNDGGVSGPSAGSKTPSTAVKAPSTSSKTKKTKKKAKPALHGDPARAILGYQAMQQNFYIPGTGLYEGEPYSYLWPFSQALAVTVSVASIPGQPTAQVAKYPNELQVRLFGLAHYWGPAGQTLPGEQPEAEEHGEGSEPAEAAGIPPPSLPSFNGNVIPPGGVSYYDDNEWVGIELARLYKLRHEAQLLEKAEQIMAFVMAGWQSNPKFACPGGIPFSDSPTNTSRNTVTDGPAAELGAQLFRITGNQTYLQFALMAYEWVRRCLVQPNGLYADHIGLHGKIEPALWSYNQGSMIGAGVLLYQSTGDSAFLYQARQTAKAALSYFTMERLLSENPFFPAVYFRNLMYLDSITHDPPGPALAQAYVNYMWVNRRLTSGLYVWGTPPSSQLLVQADVVQIYALLSTSASTYF